MNQFKQILLKNNKTDLIYFNLTRQVGTYLTRKEMGRGPKRCKTEDHFQRNRNLGETMVERGH